MIPIKFKEANVEFAKGQNEYNSLHAYKIESSIGEVISCWKLSFKEKIKILFGKPVWLSMFAFNKALPPVYLTIDKEELFNEANERAKENPPVTTSNDTKDLLKKLGTKELEGLLKNLRHQAIFVSDEIKKREIGKIKLIR